MTDMISQNLVAAFNDSNIVKANVVLVTVEMNDSSLEKVLAKKLLSELLRVSGSNHKAVLELTEEDMEAYIRTLKWLRVCHVNEDRTEAFRAYRNIVKYLHVPVLYYQVLIGIGRAYDREYNIEFRPCYSINEGDILGTDEMAAISSILRQYEAVKTVEGTPRTREGELDFMAMVHVDNEIRSYRTQTHPVYAFLAAFVRQQKLNEVTGSMSRVVYGFEEDFKYHIDALFNAIDGGAET